MTYDSHYIIIFNGILREFFQATVEFEFSGIAWNEHGMNDNCTNEPMQYTIDAA